MLKDKEFFIQVTDTLRKRRIYDDLTWKYGFYHRDEQAMKESISRLVAVLSQCGTYFESSLIKWTPETSNFRHLDYFPMINSRAHKLGDNSNPGILNRQFRETYFKFLKVSVEKNRLDETDWLNFTYYLLIQDRINEAIEIFESKIDPKVFEGQDTLRMQYDYMRAYLDFFTGFETGFKIAKAISRKYADYPVLAWKVLFTEILDQLEEFEEGIDYDEDIDQLDETKRKANLKKSINLEPTMSWELEGKLIKIEYNNIPKISVKYYAIDPEVLFSRAPFLNQNTEDFAYVKPMETQEFTLDKKLKSESFEISQNLQKSNLVIEISGEGKQSFLTYFSTSIKVAINENFGELKVTDTDDKPLAKVYVKVFSSENANSQNSKFFKDGYTDIRGKFEYAQINSKKLASIQKFAILVMSDEHGSLTREAKAPPKIAKEVEECEPYLHSSAVTKLAHQENRRMNKMKMM